jgi:Na+/H+ antiporter NhaD/arsenite permease-like protein
MQPMASAAAPGLLWAVPFLGLLVSLALGPMLAPRFWHRHAAAVTGFWIAALLLPRAVAGGPAAAAAEAWHAVLTDYLPFITLLLALHVAAGGILLRGGPGGRPWGNTLMLAVGTLLGAVLGQAGAAIVLITPLLRANAHRRRKMHLPLFVILLVANAGGALSPLGNPPLYLGYLQGVPFFWPAQHLWQPFLLLAALLLAAFYVVDRVFAAREPPPPPVERLRLAGWGNIGLVLLTGAAVLAQQAGPAGEVALFGQPIAVTRLAAILAFAAVAVTSAAFTPRAIRQANDFSWVPMIEVAQVFLAVFITLSPVLALLRESMAGPLAPLLRLTLDSAGQPLPAAYFWLTGGLSAVLDNAPTYLVFFRLAGLHPPGLDPAQTHTLAALSAGAVFFGGLTYLGNAPNLIVRGIAAHRGVRMPGFLGYAVLAGAVLGPVLLVLTVVFFR